MMAAHQPFRFASLDELRARAAELSLDLPFETEIGALRQPWSHGSWESPNRIAIHPMEGQDGLDGGSPGALTARRYRRFAEGGAGLLWFEACAVAREGRANPRQLWLHEGNVGEFAALLADARRAAEPTAPLCILQLTHSGRYSKPGRTPAPLVAAPNPYLTRPLERIVTNEELASLEDRYVHAARLAVRAGFDGVDIKACHGYLVNELLGAFTREGPYGGSFENRTRFLRNVVARLRAQHPGLLVAVRLGAFDAVPFPFGWGVSRDGDGRAPDLSEPTALVRELAGLGVEIINVTAGIPYYNPHIGRPFDQPLEGLYTPDEHPLEGVARLLGLCRDIQQAVPEIACVGTGFSWLRHYLGFAAEAAVRRGWMAFAGVGREAFANPGFARELLSEGRMLPSGVCITCSSCSELMRDGATTGCVPRDKPMYSPLFAEGRRARPGARRLPHPISSHV